LPYLGSDAPSIRIDQEAVKPFQHGKKISYSELLEMREEFWGSRVEGNPGSWQVLKGVSENILGGDLELANAILEASQITTPHGSLFRCYDELGAEYSVRW